MLVNLHYMLKLKKEIGSLSYIKALKGLEAIFFYNKFIELLISKWGKKVSTGHFGADMQIELINDVQVTILIDSKTKNNYFCIPLGSANVYYFYFVRN